MRIQFNELYTKKMSRKWNLVKNKIFKVIVQFIHDLEDIYKYVYCVGCLEFIKHCMKNFYCQP